MASRRGSERRRVDLSPRAMRIGGWVVATLIILGIALVVGLLGGDADGVETASSPTPSIDEGLRPIAFGTSLDPVTGEVATGARTQRFVAGDTFAYSVRPPSAPPSTVLVEVRRTGGGLRETVQEPSPQGVADGAMAIAFTVPADALLRDFGPGEYLMLIYAEGVAQPLAEGGFTLVGPDVSPSAAP